MTFFLCCALYASSSDDELCEVEDGDEDDEDEKEVEDVDIVRVLLRFSTYIRIKKMLPYTCMHLSSTVFKVIRNLYTIEAIKFLNRLFIGHNCS